MSKRLVFASVNQVITLIKNNPTIAEKIPKFKQLLQAQLSTTPKNTCNCARKNVVTPDVNKQVAEQILSSLNDEDFKNIKQALSLDELCYYRRNTETNKLDLICV
jgi:hypothetical protein